MRVLLCSYFKFPLGCAGAIRHEKFAQMLQQIGHEVLIVGLGEFNNFKIESYNGIKYTSFRYSSTSLISKIVMRLKYWNNLKRMIESYMPHCIIMDDMRPYVTIQLKAYAHKKNIKLIHDSVEWYSPEQFKLGVFSPAYIKKDIVNRFLVDRSMNVIAISRYLTDYYTSKKINCVNIPIVVTEEDLIKEKTIGDMVNFVYAGQAGKKDYIDIVLKAMMMLPQEELSKFKFHILGCTEEQLLLNGVSQVTIDSIRSSLIFYGRVPRLRVLEVLKQSDFTVLMRSETQRYAKAGFPTKLVESLSHSTPVIANLTSDMELYLKDGNNSLIVPECTSEALVKVLQKAIELPLKTRREMCENAYQTAKTKFYYTNFIPDLKAVIE